MEPSNDIVHQTIRITGNAREYQQGVDNAKRGYSALNDQIDYLILKEHERQCIEFPVFEPVLTKMDFVRRFQEGEFGNHAPTWNSWEEFWNDWQEDGWEERLYHIRNRIAGAKTWYNVAGDIVGDVWREASQEFDPSLLYISEMCPTEKTLFQGEVMLGPNGIELYYSTVPKPMRESLKLGGRSVRGIIASTLLKHYLDANSYDWIMDLLERRYPDHVVEFTTLSTKWGTVPDMNTLIWEVRKY